KKEDPRPIKGWWGIFRLKGPVELLRIGLDAGLGAKNSAGWGCVELMS
ncbi:MAG: CRISPR-associated protein, Cas6 family, partial [Synergistales bacterium 53_16]